MSVNKHSCHLLVLPEDDANRQLVNGFLLALNNPRQVQVLPVAGGWRPVLDLFVAEHVAGLRRYRLRNILLLLDFDQDARRFEEVSSVVPAEFRTRVFLMGAWDEPEALRCHGSLETVGRLLAEECQTDALSLWTDNQLRNQQEAARLKPVLMPLVPGD